MKFLIVGKMDNGSTLYWSSSNGWTTEEHAELFDQSDVDALLPHFATSNRPAAAIPEGQTFRAWHLTGAAIIE